MDPKQAKFFETDFEIESNGAKLKLHGLVSETGVTKIFVFAPLSDFWRGQLGRDVHFLLHAEKIDAVFLHQQVEHGSYYEIRFRTISEAAKAFIRLSIEKEGVLPNWKRKFPRIDVGDDPHLPVPNLCLLRYLGQELFLKVKNFTLGGIRIETSADQLGSVKVGQELQFDLLLSTGEILANLSAEVRNVAAREALSQGAGVITRSLGLRFLNLDPVNERKYREMIKQYCLTMKKRFNEKEEP